VEDWSPPDEFEEYRLVRLLGRGAMGRVYLAHDSLLDRPVAVKFVEAAGDPVARARFVEEARAIARLQHPNVVAIYRVGEVPGHPYLVSEYVRGKTLDQVQRPMPSRQVLDIALDLTRGLAAAHRCGVLHRDVKPANAMLADDGRAKLLDFSLAVIDGATKERAPQPPRERTSTPRLASIDTTATRPAAQPAVAASTSSYKSRPEITFGDGSPRASPEVGTPLYMAPELWRGESATRRSDLYSLGILLYELLAGVAPHRGVTMAELADIVQSRDIPRIGDVVTGVEPAFASIIDRLVERDAGARFPSADALLLALEESAAPTPMQDVPDGNPYRGLAAFDSAHGSLFFGRRGEIRELVDRVTNEPFVVVGGDSGTGKSSVCRAGVLPWLVDHHGWSRVDVVPGRHPVHSLSAALAAWSGGDEAALAAALRDTPDAVARAIRRDGERSRLLLFVDQLEELLTLSEPDEARIVAAALAALAVRAPSVRVLATARSDFLSRLAMLPGIGDEIARALYFLRPLTGERIREAIVRPAAAKGVTFESDALIDTLVAQTEQAPGGLPLLQFTLAELWDARDAEAKTIRTASLAALGGVEGALTRHADRLLAGLDGNGREAARRLLLRLVTADGTRARRTAIELLTDSGAERAALEVLVRGRIVVANDTQDGAYEIAHEALLTSWATLQEWRRRGASDQAVLLRVEQAAAAWQRMDRRHDLLWGPRQLAETKTLDRESLAPREAAFLSTSRRAIVRRRVSGVVLAVLIATTAVIVGLTIRARARRELESVIATQTRAATAALDEGRTLSAQRDSARAHAFELFDAHRWPEGEDAWTEVEALAAQEASAFRKASSHYESALSLDPSSAKLRAQFADLLFSRLLRAEQDHDRDLADELVGRMTAYDDGRYRRQLESDAKIELEVSPPGTHVSIERGTTREHVGQTPLAPLSLRPGNLVLVFEAPGHATTRLPVLLSRGRTTKLQVALPSTDSVPPGMIYVPPGRFLFGSAEGSDLRHGFLASAPIHEVSTDGYLIGRNEVTFGDWIEFLNGLPPQERARRTPKSMTSISTSRVSLELSEISPKKWRLSITPTTRTYTAETGQRFHYERRMLRADQDWMRFPVSAISFEDAIAYAAWLDRTGRLPGARLCDEYEWERAARGADARTYPNGGTLARDDANIDVTYGREPLAFGPDEVGSHPRSRSPVGADDMAGNVWEWTRSVATPGAPVARGGGWYNAELSSRSSNREPGSEPTQRNILIGLRLCASARLK